MTFVTVSPEGTTTAIRINRPPLNIINLEMMNELARALETASQSDQTAVVVLRSGVEGVFSAGADVREHLPDRADELIRTFEALVRQLLTYPMPTVSVVQGKCLGGGMELALACDFVLATKGAVFGQPEVKVGVFPPAALVLLPRTVGPRTAHDILLTGRTVPAEEAAGLGLVTRVVDEDGLESDLNRLNGMLSGHSRVVMELIKRGVRECGSLPLGEALRRSSDLYLQELMRTEDALEGLNAFLEKRKPEWKNR